MIRYQLIIHYKDSYD